MVGYFENDPMTSTHKLAAGVVSGIVTRTITQPIDVIKVRAQLTKTAKKTIYKIAKRIYTEEGIRAFYQGHNMGQVHSILSVSSQFYIYEILTKLMSKNEFGKRHRAISNLMCGTFAGIFSTALVIPLEVIRVRQILVHEQYAGILNGARNVYKSGGIKAFYEGLSASLIQMGPAVGISFSTFTLVQGLILHSFTPLPSKPNDHNPNKLTMDRPEVMMLASTVAGSTAGFLSKSLTYPFDLMKKRLQISSHVVDKDYNIPTQVKNLVDCKTLRQCFYNCYKHEGVKGFFRGWTVTIYKSQVTSVVAFTTYEMCCYVIRTVMTV